MKRTKVQSNFTGGELSPRLYGRFDLEKYHNGCRILRNAIVYPEGGAFKRPGFYYTAETKTFASVSRLIPFIFSDTDSYILEFGDEYIRFYRGWGQVLDGAVAYERVSPYAAADLALLQFAQSADVMYITHPDYQPRKLSRTGHTAWTLGVVEHKRGPFMQENDTPATITPLNNETYDIDGSSAGDDTLTISDDGDLTGSFPVGRRFLVDGSTKDDGMRTVVSTAYGDPDFVITIREDVPSGTVGDGAIYLDCAVDSTVTLTASEGIFTDDHVGALWQITFGSESEEVSKSFAADGSSDSLAVALDQQLDFTTYNTTWDGTVALEVSYDGGTNWQTVTQATSEASTNSNITLTHTEEVDDALYRATMTGQSTGSCRIKIVTRRESVNGVVRIESVSSATSAQAIVRVALAQQNTATKLWAEGAWSNKRGWPVAVTFFEQRIFYGGTAWQPTTFWGSVSLPGGDYENFLTGTNDDRAVIYTIAESQDPIKWLIAMNRLIAGTSGGSYVLSGSSSEEALTPTNVQSGINDISGAAPISPIRSSLGLLFVERGGKRVNEFVYSWEADQHVTANMTRLAEHITGSGIKEVAFQKRPERIMWCVTDDGDLVGMTYLRTENIVAWHKHTTRGSFESVAVKPGRTSTNNADEDEVWCIVNRRIDSETVRYVERMMPWDWGDDQEDVVFMDCAISGAPDDETDTPVVSGLTHLEGETVAVCADGGSHPDQIVSGGEITLDRAATLVHVGLGYASTLVPMRPASQQMGLAETTRIVKTWATFYRTSSAKYGPDASNLDTINFRDAADAMDTAIPLFSGTKPISPDGGYGLDSDLYIVSDEPLPCCLLSLVMILESN